MLIKFLIQENDEYLPIHDFSFELIQAIKYQNWFYNERKYFYYLREDVRYDFNEYIPVGSLEFVLDFYKKYYNIDNIKPINIPKELQKYEFLKRNITYSSQIKNNNLFLPLAKYFVKSNDKIKGFIDIILYKDIPQDGDYLISEVIDIKSEWRAFVFNNKLAGLQNYAGDFTMFPDVNLISKMIYAYESSPRAYTLDVGVNNKGTFLIECHQFFSCGLYGFNDYKILPQMYISTHNEIINKEN